MTQPSRRVLVVRGGWEGHSPVEATERFFPFLREHGFAIEVREDLDAYEDDDLLATSDLILQCYTQGEITEARAHSEDAVDCPECGASTTPLSIVTWGHCRACRTAQSREMYPLRW